VDTLPPGCSSTLTFFISYAWSMPFTTLVALLEHQLHAADPDQAGSGRWALGGGHWAVGCSIKLATHGTSRCKRGVTG
jgi:hypothetical protein